jgi:hypothetical protein
LAQAFNNRTELRDAKCAKQKAQKYLYGSWPRTLRVENHERLRTSSSRDLQ